MELPLATASAMFPGFRFSPTDEELISYYLKKKIEGTHSSVELISEVEIWKHEPWDLPAKCGIQSEKEWFFFSRRGRKYPNGSQSKRATESGYWKATGKERDVKSGGSSNVIGTKRTLVFHTGRAPKGQRTPWIMHEFSLINPTKSQLQDSMVVCRLRKNNEFQLNETPRNQGNNLNATMALSGADPPVGNSNAAAGDSGSKESSSSLNSHSVEQIESKSESESEEKLMNEILGMPPSESRPQELVDEDDEWFADIMKDDIVKLDDSTSIMNQQGRATRDEGCSMDNDHHDTSSDHHHHHNNQMFPFQGTANRRVRLIIKEPAATGHPESPYQGRRCCWIRRLFRMSRSRSSTMWQPQRNHRHSNSTTTYCYYLMPLAMLGLVIPMLFCCFS